MNITIMLVSQMKKKQKNPPTKRKRTKWFTHKHINIQTKTKHINQQNKQKQY